LKSKIKNSNLRRGNIWQKHVVERPVRDVPTRRALDALAAKQAREIIGQVNVKWQYAVRIKDTKLVKHVALTQPAVHCANVKTYQNTVSENWLQRKIERKGLRRKLCS